MGEDFYAVLGVERDADSATIRQAFKQLALLHHPDKVPEAERPEAEIRFKVLSEAYEVLGNEESRMLYDAQAQFVGSDWHDFYAGPGDDSFGGSQGPSWFDFGTYSQPRADPRTQNCTEDAIFEVELTLEDVYRGRMLKLNSRRQVICRRCHGTGGRPKARKRSCNNCKGTGFTKKTRMVGPGLVATETVPCPVCHGEGKVYNNRDLCRRCHGDRTQEVKTLIEVYVPKGVKNNHRIVIEGQADEEPGKQTGDLVIVIEVDPNHDRFRREGSDLYVVANITLSEALTGFSRTLIKHLDGRQLKPTVPRGEILRPGSILCIPGEGLTVENSATGDETVGDMYVQLEITFPNELDEHILDRLASLLNHDEDDGERSDDTLHGSGEFKDKPSDLNGGIDVEHEVLSEADLPAYSEDANDEPNPSTGDENAFDSDDAWWQGRSSRTGVPNCATM